MDRYCRICRNASCSNHGKNITFHGEGWKCNYIPVPTNGDRFRAMSDEQLAETIARFALNCVRLYTKDDGVELADDFVERLLEDLRKPAKGVDDEI